MKISEVRDGSDKRCSAVEDVRRLYSAHAAAIHSYLTRRVGRDLAEDLLADTFRIAIERWNDYDSSIGSARNWLYGIATNLVRRHWRTEQRRRAAVGRLAAQPNTAEDSLLNPATTATERADSVVEVQRLLDAVDRLSVEDRDLLILSAWEAMSSNDVAEVLYLAPGTVRSRLHRIRRQLDRDRSSSTTASSDSTSTKPITIEQEGGGT